MDPADLVRISKCTNFLEVAYDLTVKASFLTLDVETENLVNSAFLQLRQAFRAAQARRDAITQELEGRDNGH